MRVGRLRFEPPTRPYIQLAFFVSDPRESFSPGAAADRHVVDRLGTSVLARDHVFRVGREAVLVQSSPSISPSVGIRNLKP